MDNRSGSVKMIGHQEHISHSGLGPSSADESCDTTERNVQPGRILHSRIRDCRDTNCKTCHPILKNDHPSSPVASGKILAISKSNIDRQAVFASGDSLTPLSGEQAAQRRSSKPSISLVQSKSTGKTSHIQYHGGKDAQSSPSMEGARGRSATSHENTEQHLARSDDKPPYIGRRKARSPHPPRPPLHAPRQDTTAAPLTGPRSRRDAKQTIHYWSSSESDTTSEDEEEIKPKGLASSNTSRKSRPSLMRSSVSSYELPSRRVMESSARQRPPLIRQQKTYNNQPSARIIVEKSNSRRETGYDTHYPTGPLPRRARTSKSETPALIHSHSVYNTDSSKRVIVENSNRRRETGYDTGYRTPPSFPQPMKPNLERPPLARSLAVHSGYSPRFAENPKRRETAYDTPYPIRPVEGDLDPFKDSTVNRQSTGLGDHGYNPPRNVIDQRRIVSRGLVSDSNNGSGTKQATQVRTTVTDGGNGEIRLRVDASAPLSIQLNGDMEGRTLQIVPTDNGMADVVLGKDRETVYMGERRQIEGTRQNSFSRRPVMVDELDIDTKRRQQTLRKSLRRRRDAFSGNESSISSSRIVAAAEVNETPKPSLPHTLEAQKYSPPAAQVTHEEIWSQENLMLLRLQISAFKNVAKGLPLRPDLQLRLFGAIPSITEKGSSTPLEETRLPEPSNNRKFEANESEQEVNRVLEPNIKPAESRNDNFDSGYGSLPDAKCMPYEGEDNTKKDNEDDIRSVMTILTSASKVVLPPEEANNLILAFAGDLCQDIGLADECSDVKASSRLARHLPHLLKGFSMRLEESAGSRLERDAKEYVRQQRRRITDQLIDMQRPIDLPEEEELPSTLEAGMSPWEKMNMAGWSTADQFEAPDVTTVEHAFTDLQLPPRYQEVRHFLIEGPAYQWLIKNARAAALLTPRNETVLELINHNLNATFSSEKLLHLRTIRVNIGMDWDLPGFLRDQEYDATLESALERAITITALAQNAQALTCIDYVCQTWPSTGRSLLQSVQTALKSPTSSFNGSLDDATEFAINFETLATTIRLSGNKAAVTEAVEQLAWLGAALRTSSQPHGLSIATPNLNAMILPGGSQSHVSISIDYRVTPMPPSLNYSGNCWHSMWRNPVIANGFPILARHGDEQGLEINFDVMTLMAETQFATPYDDTLVLKGLCTMLVPTKQAENSTTWHFICNSDGKRLPYYSLRDTCKDAFRLQDMRSDLIGTSNGRHFVGWTSDITRHLGTKDACYDTVDWAGARKCSAGFAIEQKLSISASKVVGVSIAALRGNRDKPEYIKHSGYSVQVMKARKMYVTFFDTEARRGWLLDGASALLHLALTQVTREPYGGHGCLFNDCSVNGRPFAYPEANGGPNAAMEALKNESNMKHIIYREFDKYADVTHNTSPTATRKNSSSSSSNTSDEERKEVYKLTCFKELVVQAWSTLEQIYDRQMEAKTSHATKQLSMPFHNTLEGYEYMDLVSSEHLLTRRSVEMMVTGGIWTTSNGGIWTPFLRQINALTLFSQEFGELYKPHGQLTGPICENWTLVPRGHDFLAVPVSLLRDIQKESWKRGEVDLQTAQLTEGLSWCPSRHIFASCTGCCKHQLDRVQRFCTSALGQNVQSLLNVDGAVIFGDSSILDMNKLGNISPPLEMAGSFSDSGLGSSLQNVSRTSSDTVSSSKSMLSPPQSTIQSPNSPVTSTVATSSSTQSRTQLDHADQIERQRCSGTLPVPTTGYASMAQSSSVGENETRSSQTFSSNSPRHQACPASGSFLTAHPSSRRTSRLPVTIGLRQKLAKVKTLRGTKDSTQ